MDLLRKQRLDLLIEGELTVSPRDEQTLKFSTVDLVSFPKGIKCRGEVDQAVRKHYRFGD